MSHRTRQLAAYVEQHVVPWEGEGHEGEGSCCGWGDHVHTLTDISD